MAPAVTPNDSLWVVLPLPTADWYDLAFICYVSLLLLLFVLKASSAFVAEELCRGIKLTLLDLFPCGTFSEAISNRCFTLISSAGFLLVTKSTSLLPCVWLCLAMRCPNLQVNFAPWLKTCLASSLSESAGFPTSLSATGGMLAQISCISFLVKSLVLRALFTAWSLFPENKMWYLPILLHVDYICFLFTKNMFDAW